MNYTGLKGKAAIYRGANLPLEVTEYAVTPPPKGTALLKLSASGICGTDVHITRGRLAIAPPMIIGHEFVGEIIDIGGDGEGFKTEEKVLFNMATPCGECPLCEAGDSANCLNFEVAYAKDPDAPPHFHGGFGEYAYAKLSALIKIPAGVSPLAAVMFPCAGPTIIHALKLGGLFKNRAKGVKSAVIMGAGPLGLFSALWLTLAGVESISVITKNSSGSRAIAIGELTRAKTYTLDQYLQSPAGKTPADLCIECSGDPAAFQTGCEILRNRGVFLVPGQYSDSGVIPFAPQVITFKALQIFGSSQYDGSDVLDYVEFLSENKALLPKIEAKVKGFALSDINEALDAAEKHLYSKVALV